MRFFRSALLAVGVNLGIVFALGTLVGGTLFGVSLLAGYCFCYGLVPVLSTFSSVTNFQSPPYAFYPDSTYPVLAEEWYARLKSHGFQGGNIAYFCDITNGLEKKMLYVGVTFRHFMKEPVLIISESVLASAPRNYLVAFIEHEIAHMRSGYFLARCLTHSLATLGNALLLAVANVRVVFVYMGCIHYACLCYELECSLARISSRPAERADELLADALAIEAVGNPFDLQSALLWLAIEGKMDMAEHEHNEHLSTHPTTEKRVHSASELYS